MNYGIGNVSQLQLRQLQLDAPVMPQGFALSPGVLLAYCTSRLGAIDDAIGSYFAEQQERNKAMKDASDLAAIMRRLPEGHLGPDDLKANPEYKQGHADRANEILTLYRSTTNGDVKRACQETFKDITGCALSEFAEPGRQMTSADINVDGVAKGHDAAAWARKIDTVKDLQAGMSKNAELNMIQLQSMVSQRQLAIQLTTQLMQTLHESAKQITANLRA